MKRRLLENIDTFKLILFISLFVMSFSITLELYKNRHPKEFEVPKAKYKFFLEQHEGQQDYEEQSAMEFPTKGYVLNITKTNEKCTTGQTIKQNVDKSVDFLANFSTACNLYYDIKPEYKYTLEKLQELSGQWQVKSGTPSMNKTMPRIYYTVDKSSSTSTENTATTKTMTYASSYNFDEDTGLYSLVSPSTCVVGTTCPSVIKDKYVVNYDGNSASGLDTYRNLSTIYQINSATVVPNLLPPYIPVSYAISYYTITGKQNVDNSENGIWEDTDDYGKTYYVRGAYNYNYVKFANLYFRVIRINGDGSLRLMYDGTSAGAKGTISLNDYNIASNDNAYVGYMYGTLGASTYNEAHLNVNSSNAKSIIDNWYQENLSGYSSYISDTLFCNNRKLKSGNGYSTNETSYDFENNTFLFTCPQKNDRFTVSDTTIGNGALTYPVGMLTGEEVVRGGYYPDQTVYSSNYLVKNSNYYSMTPKSFMSSITSAFVLRINSNGTIGGYNVSPETSIGIVPVINLTAEAVQQFEGSGTSADPFKIKNESSSGGGSSQGQTKMKTLAKLQSLNSNITVNSGTPDFSKAATTDEGLYAAEDDYGTSYYWRGAATTNYIKFGDWYWRIIRINGDDSLRLFYDGTSLGANGNIGTSSFNTNNSNNAYVGYMYGSSILDNNYEATHKNSVSSAIKGIVDSWYESNIKNKSLEDNISDTLFCNDRELVSGSGYSTTTTTYGAYKRLRTNKTPSLECTQKNDSFTTTDTTLGNGSLSYPIGLITADEISMAGGLYNTNNTSYYLYKSNSYWTMTPSNVLMDFINCTAFNYNVTNGAISSGNGTNDSMMVIPVINISNDAIQTMTGSGTSTDPFVVH